MGWDRQPEGKMAMGGHGKPLNTDS
jgi:hypothetical protein